MEKEKKTMKINIAASHRFHLLDLARELVHQGYDVRFYSYVPNKRCQKFGLGKEYCYSLLWLAMPFIALHKIFPKVDYLIRFRNSIMDFYLSHFMRKCDIFIALGTVYKQSFVAAKKHGSITIMEWGSKHIDEQQKILAKIHAHLNKEYYNKRSRDAYELVDYISVASQHVVDSFLLHDYPIEKLFKNPYGVDLSMFSSRPDVNKEYDFIMVGGWSYRKGCDLIVEAIRKTRYTLLHVGSLVDVPFPEEERFTHIDSVAQSKLIEFYAQAKVFVLPSREEGLAMVQVQAIACNLPLIGSKNSGAKDLKEMVKYPEYVTVLNEYTVDALIKAMDEAMASYSSFGDKIYAGTAIENLTWEAYGRRYAEFLDRIWGYRK